tara:strand:+ start:473 stop:733 length:261 start_codon:yes stop_codon:yes gene_type:complete
VIRQQLYPGIDPGTIIQGIADQVIQDAFDVLGIAKDLGSGQVDVGERVGPPFYFADFFHFVTVQIVVDLLRQGVKIDLRLLQLQLT